MLKLTIELVPATAWNNNLRKILKPSVWNKIRNEVYKKYDYKCAICQSPYKLHCHEVWDYDDLINIQKLVGLQALCRNCHLIKHIGLAGIKSKNFENVIKHFMKVNSCDRVTFQKHYKDELELFEKRSHFDWELDLQQEQRASQIRNI